MELKSLALQVDFSDCIIELVFPSKQELYQQSLNSLAKKLKETQQDGKEILIENAK